MDYKKLVESLEKMLPPKIPYGELVGAPWPYTGQGKMVYEDPESYFIEQAITAINDLLARAESAESRAEKAERERDAAIKMLRKIEWCNGCPIANAFDRLAAIEDILGDDYDLERLKELVEADREGRCVVLSDGSYTDKDGEEALKNAMFILSLTNDGINRYIADAIAEKLVREESEAALKKMKRGNE